MTGPIVEETKTWNAFMSFVERTHVVGSVFQSAYYYRGQPRAAWDTLWPSLLRLARNADLQPDAAVEVEKLLVSRFKVQAFTHLSHAAVADATLLGWWSLMQHHGVPTRLLDWTKSIYVAAYFAVESEPEHDSALWVVHPRSVRVALTAKFPAVPRIGHLTDDGFWRSDSLADLEFLGPTRETSRMTAQQTLFSLSRWVLADHGAIIGDAVKQEQDRRKPVLFCKVLIPRQAKPLFLRRLAEEHHGRFVVPWYRWTRAVTRRAGEARVGGRESRGCDRCDRIVAVVGHRLTRTRGRSLGH